MLSFCNIFIPILEVSFGIIHHVVDGLGVAVYRLFCIKNNALVKGQIQEHRLFNCIWYGGFTITTFLTILFTYGSTNDSIAINLCTGDSEFVAQMWLDYQRSHGVELNTTIAYKIITLVVLIGMTLMELTCYLIFFHHCYRNDNGNVQLFLPRDVTRKRNQRNAITFVGHVYSFIVGFSFLTGSLLLQLQPNIEIKQFGTVAKITEFAVISAVEVLTSAPVRKSFLETFTSLDVGL